MWNSYLPYKLIMDHTIYTPYHQRLSGQTHHAIFNYNVHLKIISSDYLVPLQPSINATWRTALIIIDPRHIGWISVPCNKPLLDVPICEIPHHSRDNIVYNNTGTTKLSCQPMSILIDTLCITSNSEVLLPTPGYLQNIPVLLDLYFSSELFQTNYLDDRWLEMEIYIFDNIYRLESKILFCYKTFRVKI